jgi:hypothetical protein
MNTQEQIDEQIEETIDEPTTSNIGNILFVGFAIIIGLIIIYFLIDFFNRDEKDNIPKWALKRDRDYTRGMLFDEDSGNNIVLIDPSQLYKPKYPLFKRGEPPSYNNFFSIFNKDPISGPGKLVPVSSNIPRNRLHTSREDYARNYLLKLFNENVKK